MFPRMVMQRPKVASGFKARDSPLIVVQLRQAGGIQSADGWSGFTRQERSCVDGPSLMGLGERILPRVINRRYGLLAREDPE